jgi:hypothetical protein
VRTPPEWPCDLDPAEFNVATASWRGDQRRWVACRHGVGSFDMVDACGCDVCATRAATMRAPRHPAVTRRPPAPPAEPRTVDVAPVREHVEQLLAAGMSRKSIAVAAGIDRTTVNRLLRADVTRVHVDTAETLLAVVA